MTMENCMAEKGKPLTCLTSEDLRCHQQSNGKVENPARPVWSMKSKKWQDNWMSGADFPDIRPPRTTLKMSEIDQEPVNLFTIVAIVYCGFNENHRKWLPNFINYYEVAKEYSVSFTTDEYNAILHERASGTSFDVVDIQGDGNCFFVALSFQKTNYIMQNAQPMVQDHEKCQAKEKERNKRRRLRRRQLKGNRGKDFDLRDRLPPQGKTSSNVFICTLEFSNTARPTSQYFTESCCTKMAFSSWT